MQDTNQPRNTWLKPLADYGPLVAFFISYKALGLLWATTVLVAATLLAVGVTYRCERRVPLFPLISAAVVALFGGLTLLLHDERFIKLKPTIVSGLFAAAFFYAWVAGKDWLKSIMGSAVQLDPTGWRKLTLRWSLLFALLALANEVVWRTQSTDFWVNFKVFGITGGVLLFSLAQLPLIQKYQVPEDSPQA